MDVNFIVYDICFIGLFNKSIWIGKFKCYFLIDYLSIYRCLAVLIIYVVGFLRSQHHSIKYWNRGGTIKIGLDIIR